MSQGPVRIVRLLLLDSDASGERRPAQLTDARASNATSCVATLVTSYAASYALSSRETMVLSLGAEGLHRKAVAARLGCSAGTVDTYWVRILRKTGLESQAAVHAALLRLALSQETSALQNSHSDDDERTEKQDKTPSA
jgi:DNA-binding NarL/FixJ family response regulator